jgi:DNA invertase Pin-like site-specific DNA recombinase
MRAVCYARLSNLDKKSLADQMIAMSAYARKHKLEIVKKFNDVEGASKFVAKYRELISSEMGGKIELILVWKLDRLGRSLSDLISSLKEIHEAGIGIISVCESFSLNLKSNSEISQLLKVLNRFDHELHSKQIKAGIADAVRLGKPHGRPVSVGKKIAQIRKLYDAGVSKAEIARRLKVGRTSIRRLLNQ